jgi:hypothetical protein
MKTDNDMQRYLQHTHTHKWNKIRKEKKKKMYYCEISCCRLVIYKSLRNDSLACVCLISRLLSLCKTGQGCFHGDQTVNSQARERARTESRGPPRLINARSCVPL